MSSHFAVPDVHDSVPVWHWLVGAQAMPSLQLTQAPSLQTFPEPQLVPLATLPASMHAGVPVVQSVFPAWQGFAG